MPSGECQLLHQVWEHVRGLIRVGCMHRGALQPLDGTVVPLATRDGIDVCQLISERGMHRGSG